MMAVNNHTVSSPGILILSAPSGGGKSSLARALVAARDDAGIAVSHTTRPQRPGEVDGADYHFVDKSAFEKMIANNQFIEFATVFDHCYGTSIAAMEKLILNGRHAILDIDWQGARNIRSKYPLATSVFVMPPSMQALEKRLKQRRQDSEDIIAHRMMKAKNEMSHKDEFHKVILNDGFDRALTELEAVLNGLGPAVQGAG